MRAGDQPMSSQSEGTLAMKIPISAGTVEKSGPFSEDAAESTVRGTAGDNRVSVFNYSFCTASLAETDLPF